MFERGDAISRGRSGELKQEILADDNNQDKWPGTYRKRQW